MTWTWDSTDLSTALAQVRSTIGDTNTNSQILTDEQIEWRLGQFGDNVEAASIRCVQDIIAKFARDYDRSNVGMSASRSQQIQHYKDLLAELKAESGAIAELFCGGMSEAEEDALRSNSDFKPGKFYVGQDSNRGAGDSFPDYNED